MSDKFIALLGLAQKSNNLVSGENTCEIYLKKNAISLLIMADDTSENSLKKFTSLCKITNTPYIVYGNRDVLSSAIGKSNRAIYGIKDKNFADKLKDLYEKEI